MAEQVSAPHSNAASAMNKTSSSLCWALSARGSGNRRKTFLNFPIGLSQCFGSRPQNPSCVAAQYPSQIHMRFPYLEGGGRRASQDASPVGVKLHHPTPAAP